MKQIKQTYGFDQDTDPEILEALAYDGYSGHFARAATASGWKSPVYKSGPKNSTSRPENPQSSTPQPGQ